MKRKNLMKKIFVWGRQLRRTAPSASLRRPPGVEPSNPSVPLVVST